MPLVTRTVTASAQLSEKRHRSSPAGRPPVRSPSSGYRHPVNVDVEVGEWEHECCGGAIERNDVVDVDCFRWTGPDGTEHLVETHHDLEVQPRERVRGRVLDIHLVEEGKPTRALLRVPSGGALSGWDDADDGHLEDPWTGEVITSSNHDFLVTIQTTQENGRGA